VAQVEKEIGGVDILVNNAGTWQEPAWSSGHCQPRCRAITYLAWRTGRAAPDDLGPIIAQARERFAVPLTC
jgi:NAD(P)-dependent dehydrogenase (short-subunit alcohol dehydrogenase family)